MHSRYYQKGITYMNEIRSGYSFKINTTWFRFKFDNAYAIKKKRA